MSFVRVGRGRPVTLFAPGGPGHGTAVDVVQGWVRCLRIAGTKLFFEYQRSGHFEETKGIRREADRDAFEVSAVARDGRATRAIGFSRGARAIVGAMTQDPGRFDRVVLVWPPNGWPNGHYATWVGHEKLKPERVVQPGAEVLIVAQHIDSGHPMKMAEQWAWALGARLEEFPRRGLLWEEHRVGFKEVVAGFLND